MAVRFHLDEHVAGAVATALRRRGISVTTTAEAGLRSATDVQHFEYARADRRAIFTQDDDFLALAASGLHHAGLVYCKQGSRAIGNIIDFLVLVDACLSQEDMIDHIEFC